VRPIRRLFGADLAGIRQGRRASGADDGLMFACEIETGV
jgi:hypothetical protein